MADQTPQHPQGWYADPQDPGRWRWWDGTRWTEHVSGTHPAFAAGDPRPKTDGFAIAALILGIFGGVVLSAIFAFVALSRIRAGKRRGKGLAIAALVFNVLWLGVIALGVVAVVTDKPNADRFSGERKEIARVADDIENAADDKDGEAFCARLVLAFRVVLARDAGGTCADWLERETEDTVFQESIDVKTIDIRGPAEAVMRVEEGDTPETWTLVKQDGRWLLSDIEDDD